MSEQVFNVNPEGLFDDIQHTQAGLPHLVQFLWDKYVVHLKELAAKRKAEKKPTREVDGDLLQKMPAIHFCAFAAKYLSENRHVQSFFVDENHGITLSNNEACVLSPGVMIRGTMQNSGAVEVTKGESPRGSQGGTLDSPSFGI